MDFVGETARNKIFDVLKSPPEEHSILRPVLQWLGPNLQCLDHCNWGRSCQQNIPFSKKKGRPLLCERGVILYFLLF